MTRRLSLAAISGVAALSLTATGGHAFGPATVPSNPNQLEVVVRGADGALWSASYDGAAWHWESLHGLPTSDASIVASATGQLDVFVRGRDNALWHKVWSGSWGAWGNVGGSLAGEPAAVSSSPGTIDVFVEGMDGGLWDSHFDSSGQRWINLGGRLAGAPVAVSSASDTADAFVRGTDNAVWHASVIGSTSTALRWELVGGRTLEKPSVASRTTGLVTAEAEFDVFIEGDDQALSHASKTGVYPWVWENLGGRLISRPSAAEAGTAGRARPMAFVEGADQRLWQWNGFWQQLGGQLAFPPAAATLGGTVHAFVQGADNALWHEWRGTWENVGGLLAAPPCGAPANPWGYNLCGGTFIYAPPASFCGIFDCIPSFWSASNGYVTQCYDGRYSHAGGQPGTCVGDLGEFRPLWAL
jgi:hypothetical protein